MTLCFVALGCSAARYTAAPESTVGVRSICGVLTHGANAKVVAFSRRELGGRSLLADRERLERAHIVLDVVRLSTSADAQGRYCLTLPDDDEYALSFRGDGRWATVVWAWRAGGTLNVELR